MNDPIYDGFLRRQHAEGLELAANSDLLELTPDDATPPSRYLARFLCKGLVRTPAGAIETARSFLLGIWFPSDYLRRVDPFQVLTLLGPPGVFHPNIGARAPLICLGHIVPGTPLVDLLDQAYEVLTYNKVTMCEDDALNRDACVWARENQHRFPVDRRPLRRRVLRFDLPVVDIAPEREVR